MNKPLIQTENIQKYFRVGKNSMLHAVDGVSISIDAGKTLGVVGESGCGKSTLGRVILRLIDPTGGKLYFDGKDITNSTKKETALIRHDMQMIFQDPYSSLNPRMSVRQLIAEPILINKLHSDRTDVNAHVAKLMDTVGLALRLAEAYPHELDGGRRQRIGLARVLALDPRFVVCDEPVSALDVSIQAQILNLLMDLQEELSLTYMFITHDLSVVKHISNDIAVMYLGKCVEKAPSEELFANPMHPYTKALLSAVPEPDISMAGKQHEVIRGEVVSPVDPKPGCRFAPRCPLACSLCHQEQELVETVPGHSVACQIVLKGSDLNCV